MSEHTGESTRLLERAAAGDEGAWAELFARYRNRLHRIVHFRHDRRAQARFDASDVLQEAYLEAWRGLAEYLREPKIPFFLWLRLITRRKLFAMLRHELGAEMRDPRREVSLDDHALSETTSAVLAERLIDSISRPGTKVAREEIKRIVYEKINSLDPLDREVLTLRHFEQLTNLETAQVLGIQQSAASKRHLRALRRLKDILAELPGKA